jgi:hypothetical protein
VKNPKPIFDMTDGTIDPKLNHLVRKYLSSNTNDGGLAANEDQVLDWLRKKYREYQRKDTAKLRRQVQAILTSIEENDAQDDEYDKEALAHDERRNKMNHNNNNNVNSLNASLTKRYRKLQQDRDAEEEANRALQAAEAADVDETNDIGTTEATTNDINSTESSKKRSREDSGSINGASHSSMEKRSSKPIGGGKSTKRKKSSGARKYSSKSGYDEPGMSRKDAATTNLCEAVPRPTERYTDLGGMGDVLTQIRQLVEYPLVRPELYRHLGVDPPRGVLLRGPPG